MTASDCQTGQLHFGLSVGVQMAGIVEGRGKDVTVLAIHPREQMPAVQMLGVCPHTAREIRNVPVQVDRRSRTRCRAVTDTAILG